MSSPACAEIRRVDRHFGSGLRPDDERRLRAHLPGCDACRERYDRQLALAALLPGRPGGDARDRLAIGLGLARRPAWRLSWPAWVLPLAAAAAAVVLLRGRAVEPDPDTGFVARGDRRGSELRSSEDQDGKARAKPELLAYRIAGSGGGAIAARLGDRLASTDELSFAYRNPGGARYLLVFAVDAAGAVYWYHPAWTTADRPPAAVPIERGADVVELAEAIAHPLRPGPLWLHAAFSERPWSVLEVEAMLRGRPPAAPLPAEVAADTVRTVEIVAGGGAR